MVTEVPGLGKTAIFCGGMSYHYLNRNPDCLLCGPDLVANKLMEIAGYRVVRVKSSDFGANQGNRAWLIHLIRE